MSASHAPRWDGHCHGCDSATEVESRPDHAMRVLCDRCAATEPRATSASGPISSPRLYLVPDPGPDPGSVEDAEIDVYLRQFAAGRLSPLLAPLEVVLPDLPAHASPAMRAVRDDFRLVRGIRLAACDDRPVPYGAGWVAARLGLCKGTVVTVRRALVGAGVLTFEGELPARGKGNGTKTYLPGGGAR